MKARRKKTSAKAEEPSAQNVTGEKDLQASCLMGCYHEKARGRPSTLSASARRVRAILCGFGMREPRAPSC